MKIAMILRADADRVFGGDTLVMQKLSAALRDLGAATLVGHQDEMPSAREFDLLHIFTLTPVDHAARMVAWAQSGATPIVFSPLYYSDFRDWFERAIRSAPRWRSLAQRLGKPRAWGLHRSWQASRLPFQHSWWAGRAALLAATTVATTSRWENAWLARHFRFPATARSRMRISPLGIDAGLYGRTFAESELAAFRQRYDLEPGYVCQVGRIEQKKNQLAVIEALFDDPVPLVFVGKDSPYYAPDYPDLCREIAAQRGHVKFLGWLPENELPLLYAASAAHVLPSWMELPGLTSLEAGASGTRVISTQVSALHELLGDRVRTCDPYDLDSIRAAILAALASPRSTDLREYLLMNYSWPTVAAANLALYEEVLGFSRPNRL